MEEIWKDIKDFEGLYQISNFGKVKNSRTNRILKNKKDKDGYLYVILSKKSKIKALKIHRLVGMAFILNIKNKPQINHIDGNKENNNVENLEWCTHEENMKHAWKNNLMPIIEKGKYSKKSKIIYQIEPSNNEIVNIFYGNRDVERKTGYDHSSISKSCNNKKGYEKCYGYIWKYKEES